MCTAHPFRPKFASLILLLLAAGAAGQALANVGRVEFVTGDVTAVSTAGQRRALARGEELSQGDTIHTNAGRAQIRFADGAYVSLQPGTEFGIKEYNFDGKADGTERGFFALLKGAMRAVTGLIGHVDHSKYRIRTPTATVGIRGTGGLIQVLNDGATLIRGSSGIWVLSSPAGSVEVPAGTSAIAPANPGIPPHETSQGPSLPPPPPVGGLNNDFRQGDQVKPDGTPASLSIATVTAPPPTPLQSGSGYAAAVAYSDPNIDSNLQGVLSSGSPATAVFDTAGALTHVNFTDQGTSAQSVFNLNPDGTQVQGESGNDGIIAWGRWTGGVNISCGAAACPIQPTYNDNQGLHYVVGLPTPSLPTSGTAAYALLGATSPTYVDGASAPGKFTGSLNVTFNPTYANVGMNFNVAMPNGVGYSITGSTTTASSLFSASTNNEDLSVSGTGGGCATGGCSSQVQGFFAGASAQRAGVAYQINDSSAQILGAAAFTKK